ncbi:surface protein [Histomonas meleagridis]|uniref:surface protein n=1 Tax=Histomonas meleagridis TaxID=135588 RepID=UPI00355A58F1|nr:surface protein [Histomonas meleagridis]KAH0805685.1 surface protein [Histomonas meleagridis]
MQYAPKFKQYFGLTPKQVASMPIQEFQQKLNFILDQPPIEKPKPKPKKRDTASAVIKSNQDSEYVEALSLEKAKEMELESQMREIEKMKKEEDQKIEEEREQMVLQKSAILELARQIPEEPENGVCIAVVLPNGRRVQRKFSPSTKGEVIYQWVSGFEELFENELNPISFSLVQVLGVRVNEDETIEEQKMRNRVLLNVLTED